MSSSSTYSFEPETRDVAEKLVKQRLWEPEVLRKRSLAIFLTCIIALALGLAAAFAISERNYGLGGVDGKYYYTWTYGPTAIFALFSAYWYLVEFRAKQIMPWVLMSKGATPAADSVLLDYISPWSITALWTSFRRRHYLVTLAIAGGLLLQLATILSTGLLAVQHVAIEALVPITVTQEFDPQIRGLRATTLFTDTLPFILGYGEQFINVSYTFGTTQHHAFPEFGSTTALRNHASLTGQVDVLSFDPNCNEARAVHRSDSFWSLITPLCNISVEGVENGASQGSSSSPSLASGFAECNVRVPSAPASSAAVPSFSPRAEAAFYYTFSKLSEEPPGRLVHVLNGHNKTNQRYEQMAGVVCAARYNISQGTVTYSGSTRRGTLKMDVKPSGKGPYRLQHVTASDLLQAAYPGFLLTASSSTWILRTPQLTGRQSDMSSVSKYLEQLLGASAIQIAKQNLLKPAHVSKSGYIHEQQARLYVQLLSFALIETACVLVAIITITLISTFHPQAVCSIDPNSLGSLAVLLRESQSLETALQRSGYCGMPFLNTTMKDCTYSTLLAQSTSHYAFQVHQHPELDDFDQDDSIDPDHGQSSAEDEPAHSSAELHWWRPFPIDLLGRLLTIGTTLSLCVALEIVYWQSSLHNGLANIGAQSFYIQSCWTYLPALVMAGVQTLFSSLFFAAGVFQPFSALHRGAATAKEALLNKSMGMHALQSLFHSIWRRTPALATTSLAASLAPFLTISVSGLYQPVRVTGPSHTAIVQQSSVWNFNNGYYKESFEERH